MAAYPPEDRTDHPNIAGNPIEEHVPNEAKVLPSSRNTVMLLSGLVAVLLVVAVTVSFAAGMEVLGLILAVVGVALGAVAIVMARGDARVSTATPIVATICAAVLAIIIGFDAAEVDDVLEEGAVPAAATVGGEPANLPEDPADIVDTPPPAAANGTSAGQTR